MPSLPDAVQYIYIDLVRRKDKISFSPRMEMLNVLYILEALRHNNMPGLLPGWTRKDMEQLPKFFFTATGRNAKRVLYPRSAQA